MGQEEPHAAVLGRLVVAQRCDGEPADADSRGERMHHLIEIVRGFGPALEDGRVSVLTLERAVGRLALLIVQDGAG